MKPSNNIEVIVRKMHFGGNEELHERLLANILKAYRDSKSIKAEHHPIGWRTIMESRITKFATAAVIIIAAVFLVNIFNRTMPTATAAEVLQDAVNAVSDVWSVHMKTRMRTLPGDNFSYIDLDFDFVPIEMWKRTNSDGQVQWRIEKPGRVLLMDGTKTIMLIRPNHGVLVERPLPLGSYDAWFGPLLNVNELLDSELKNELNNPSQENFLYHENIEGQDKIILEVEAAANVPEGDYLRNKFISDSNHLKIYQFDVKSKLLESFAVYVHTEDEDVLIFEVTDIQYNINIENDVFLLDLPENMVWYGEPEILPDNERYAQMSPKEAASAFFQACADKDWEEVLKYWSAPNVDEHIKTYLGGLTIISIGEPFQSEGYTRMGWFVPYEIKTPSAEYTIKVSKENKAERYVMTEICDIRLQTQQELIWTNEPEILPNNDVYAKMSAEDVVRAFNDAYEKGDYEEMRKFAPDFFVNEIMQALVQRNEKGEPTDEQQLLESIGEAIWSQEHSAYFVKCVLAGQVRKHILAIRKDNPAGRFVVDGGI
ncbi:MAG: hypothetical protein WC962_01595 [Phycisphaerae bacterium]|jgi:hypothetical protein